MRSDIDKDIVAVTDRYAIELVMDKLIEYLNEKDVVKLKEWCTSNLGVQTDVVSDSLDKTVLRGIQTDLDNLHARIGRLERRSYETMTIGEKLLQAGEELGTI